MLKASRNKCVLSANYTFQAPFSKGRHRIYRARNCYLKPNVGAAFYVKAAPKKIQ